MIRGLTMASFLDNSGSLDDPKVERVVTEPKYITKNEHKDYISKTFQSVLYVPKGWGYEKWAVNKPEYCGKLLFFNKGKKCSWHYHVKKDEVFYLHSGSLIVRYSDEDDIETCKTIKLKSGEAFHVYRGLRHQMEAIEDTELFEFSTQHFDEDSHRIIKGD